MTALAVLGETPALGWLAERAFRQGGVVLRGHRWQDAMLLNGLRCLLIGEGLFAAPPLHQVLRPGDVVLDVSTDWFEQRPQRIEQLGLNTGQLGNVSRPTQPAHVGMAAHDARCRTGRIKQDAVIQSAIPPVFGPTGVANHDVRLQTQALQVLRNAFAAPGVNIQRSDLAVGQLQQVRGLAAGRGAGVEHPHAVGWREQPGGPLRPGVLDGHEPFGETGEAPHGHRLRQQQRVGRQVDPLDRLFCEQPAIGLGLDAAAIDAQRHRRMHRADLEDAVGGITVLGAQMVDPPARMGPASLRIAACRVEENVALAQETAQGRVDEAGGAFESEIARGRLWKRSRPGDAAGRRHLRGRSGTSDF